MTFAGYSFVGFRDGYGSGLKEPAHQPALLIDRQLLVKRIPVYSPPFFPLPTTLRPTVVPWFLGVDRWGVSYPAGLFGVVDRVAQLYPAADPFSTEWVDLWASDAMNVSSAFDAHVVAVPQVLPVGYSARYKRDWHAGTPVNALNAGYVNFGPISSGGYPVRLIGNGGFARYRWLPHPFIWGHSGHPLAGGAVVNVGSKFFMVYDAGPGNRKVQIQLGFTAVGGTWSSGTADVKLSHNPAGPIGSTSSDGSTVDYTRVFTLADFSFVGSNGLTAWIDVGVINGNLQNTLTEFQSSIDMTSALAGGFASTTGYCSITFRLSPRCDIPLPFTTTSKGNVIAPGGIVTGSIPGY